jgi:hypothetical protein
MPMAVAFSHTHSKIVAITTPYVYHWVCCQGMQDPTISKHHPQQKRPNKKEKTNSTLHNTLRSTNTGGKHHFKYGTFDGRLCTYLLPAP